MIPAFAGGVLMSMAATVTPATGRVVEAETLDVVDQLRGGFRAVQVVALLDEVRELAQVEELVAERHRRKVVVGSGITERQDLVEDDPADGRGDDLGAGRILLRRAVRMHVALGHADPNALVQVHDVVLERELCLTASMRRRAGRSPAARRPRRAG